MDSVHTLLHGAACVSEKCCANHMLFVRCTPLAVFGFAMDDHGVSALLDDMFKAAGLPIMCSAMRMVLTNMYMNRRLLSDNGVAEAGMCICVCE
jgi:hypothetical protein